MRAGVVGVPRSMKFGYLRDHGRKVLNGGWKVSKQSARIDIRAVGSLGMSDLKQDQLDGFEVSDTLVMSYNTWWRSLKLWKYW